MTSPISRTRTRARCLALAVTVATVSLALAGPSAAQASCGGTAIAGIGGYGPVSDSGVAVFGNPNYYQDIRLSSRFGGDSSVREFDGDAGAAEVDHRD